MNSENGGLYFGAGIDNSQLRSDAAESKKILSGIGDKAVIEGDRIDDVMKKVGATIVGAFAVDKLKDFVTQVTKIRGEFQQLEIAFTTMLGDKLQADALMSQLIETATTTPFNMGDIADSAKQLLAYGVAADEVNDTLIRLGDIAAGLSIPVKDLAYLYGTTMVQGRLYTQDLNQFLGRGIPLTAELAKQFGVTQNKVKGLVEEGKVGFPEVQQAIINLTSEGSKFGGLMAAQSKSIAGQIANIEDAIEQMFNELGKRNEGFISETLEGVSMMVENWESIGKALLVVISVYGTYKAAILAVWAAHKLMNVGATVTAFISLTRSITSAKDAMLLFNMATRANPIGLVASVVAGAAAAFLLFKNSANEAADAAKQEQEAIKEFNRKVGEEAGKSITIYQNLQSEYKKLKTAHEKREWISKMQGKFKDLNISVTGVNDAEHVFVRNTTAMLESFKKRAEAAAWQGKLNEAYAKKITRQMELEQEAAKITAGSKSHDVSHTTEGGYEYVNREGFWAYTEKGAARARAALLKNDSALKQINQEIETYVEKVGQVSKQVNDLVKEAGTHELSDKEKKKLEEARKKAEVEAKRIADQTADRIKEIERYKKDIIAANTKAELDIRQQKLESLQDGFDKELQLIALNYDRLVAENAERERQMLEALADNKLREWLNKNPKATKQQQLDYRLNILNPKNENRLTTADLTSEQRAQLAAYAKVAVDIKVQAERSLYNRLMDEYQDYETRRKEVHRKHDEDRRSLEAAPIDTTAKEAAIAELERKRKEALKNINNEQAESIQKSSDLFVKLFSDTSEKSGKEISKIISQTEKLLNYLKNTAAVDITPKFGFTAEQLKSLQASPEKLKEYTEQFKRLKEAVRKGNPFKVLAKDISNLFKKNKDSDKDSGIEARLKKLGASASESADMVARLSEKLSKMFEAAGNESMAQAMSDVTDIMNSVSNIGKGFAEGGLIGGISALVGEGIGWVTKAFEASARHATALKEIMEEVTSQQRAYNLALLDESLAFEKAITIFGTLDYMKSNNAVDVMRKAWAELRKEIEGTIAQQRKFEYDQTKDLFWGARYNRNGKLKSDYSGLADIFIKTGHEKTGLFGWGKGKDIYTSLLDVYPELIDKQGRFNIELAKTIIDTRTFNGEGKEALQYMIELAEKAEEAYQGVKDYLVGIFGELGNTLSDVLVEAFRNGTDAADSFGDSVAKMLEKIGEQMIFSAMFSQIIQQANDAMLDTMTNVSLTEEQKFNRYVEILDTMTTGILGQQDNYNALMKRYQELAKVKGIDLWKSEEEESREASKKGIASASQESIDELNGRATAIQGHTFSISENTKLLLDTSNRILLSVLNIESNTNGLSDRVGGVERNVNEIKNVVNEISVKGIKIR